MESIQVGYRKIGPNYYHQYIVYTDSSGKQYAASGWAGGGTNAGINDLSQSGSSGSGSSASDFGTIITTHGVYDSSYPDHPLNPNAAGQEQYFEDIVSGADLSSEWQRIKDAMDAIEREGHQYRPLDQNSNTTAGDALTRAGLPEPQNDGIGGYWSPGADNDLPSVVTPETETSTAPDPEPPPPILPPPPPPPIPTPPQVFDPLSLDLNGDGTIGTLPITEGVFFDLDNSGFAEKTSWVAPEDGLLVLDRNQNNHIDGGAELFGTETLLSTGQYAKHGYEALAEFD
ncbi:MAG: hypothetical protein WAO12_09375, partial [Venatoribacter sp.]